MPDRLRLVSLLALAVALAGCDATLTDPIVVDIHGADVTEEAVRTQGDLVFVRLTTAFDSADSGVTHWGAYPLRLDVLSGVSVATTAGPFEGEALTVEVRGCEATVGQEPCAESVVVGRTVVAPGAWKGTERTVDAGGVSVRLRYRRRSS